MITQAISTRCPAVLVEYTARGRRAAKRFDDPFAARRFYARKLKTCCDPKVRRAEDSGAYRTVG